MAHVERTQSPDHLDVAIIGAGVVGLAIARVFSMQGRQTAVFESEQAIGMHTSSRNSEVIHSGIYYETPLKTELCVEGRKTLYEYCEEKSIPHKKSGKLLVATSDEELPRLTQLKERGESNGVHDLEWLGANDIADLEPEVQAVQGILSPSTGVIDSHTLMNSLRNDAVAHDAVVMLTAPLLGGRVQDNGIKLALGDRDHSMVLCEVVINSAGLSASEVAHSIAGVPKESVLKTYFAKGHYFTIVAKPFNHLVYPIPEAGGLGIHATLDIEGNVKFGPDVQWVDEVDYSFDESRAVSFYSTIRKYYPKLKEGSLLPGYTGIRPKIVGPGEGEGDFVIAGPNEHGVPGLVNLFGIESPGLTASLALADHVSHMV